MSYKIIAEIILFLSSIGLGAVVLRKIPILSALPVTIAKKGEESLILKLKRKIKQSHPLRDFSYEIFLQKILTKIRILSLKTDNKTFSLLQKLKEDAQKKKIRENDNYWKEVKKATKEK